MSQVLNFRVSPEQKALIGAQAKAKGMTVSELLRHAMLDLVDDAQRLTDEGEAIERGEVVAPAPAPEPAPEDVEALAKRIYNSQGVPMALARRKAREELADG